ncbi:helix-turn-helix domain-containing protein [Halomicroarcula limicola]|uniref:Helix-turn-helix domain-containing protein n=1 Tax=Haloarcula limicola TaxID=1429915 RepID=A0A8J7YEH0_9EURY|nr:helix-turn-helix domain-containing protein [Halomicroarcula limicola]MBV0926419.1 helix-turn-helix domain-containing protein [Halomicroarcula limicola]
MTDKATKPGVGGSTALSSLLGETVERAILTALVETAGSECTPSQICQRADITLETFYEHVDKLEDADLVRYTYVVGNGPVYEVERTALANELRTIMTDDS